MLSSREALRTHKNVHLMRVCMLCDERGLRRDDGGTRRCTLHVPSPAIFVAIFFYRSMKPLHS